MSINQNVTLEAVMSAIEDDDNVGFCIACGNEQSGCEPDMQDGECECCGESKVYGAEELLVSGMVR